MMPVMPPSTNNSMADTWPAMMGSFQSIFHAQSTSVFAPRRRPDNSSIAPTLNAVSKLGMATTKVKTV